MALVPLGVLGGVSGCRLHPGPEPIDVVTWGVKPHMEDLFLSLYLSVSPYLSKQTFKKQD